jgi:hypothetical protein
MIIHNMLLIGARDPRSAIQKQQSCPRARIVSLVSRYPEISGAEASEIIRFIRTARYSEIASLTADESVRKQLDHFIRTHNHEFRWSAGEWIAPIALLIGIVGSAWLLWPFL